MSALTLGEVTLTCWVNGPWLTFTVDVAIGLELLEL